MISQFQHGPATAAANFVQIRRTATAIRGHNDPLLQASVRESVCESLAAGSGQQQAEVALRVLEHASK